jgi:hypothetical protein
VAFGWPDGAFFSAHKLGDLGSLESEARRSWPGFFPARYLTLAPIEDWRGEDALVARPHLEVEVRLLLPGGAAFLHALAAGRPLGAAAERALAECPQFDLPGNLAGLIGWGLARRIVLTDSSGPALP